ncbi:MAG: non-reducing end alpha-L-arabinofuranosidase family hydrolase [Reinekea sp.]
MNSNLNIFVKNRLACVMLASVALAGCNLEEPITITTSHGSLQASEDGSTGQQADNTGGTPANGGDDTATAAGNNTGNPANSPNMVDHGFAVNGGVENGLINWGSAFANISQSTSVAHSGSASAVITGRNATWQGLTFKVGNLTQGNEYNVSVWVKLADGAYDTALTLTAKRHDDNDNSTYREYTNIATVTAKSNEWTKLQGYYTQNGTEFEHFIIESKVDAKVSFYVDDFSIFGEVSDNPAPAPQPETSDFFVGNITTYGAVRSDFTRYWNQITPENEGKWASVEGTRDSYNWRGLDAAYNYAKENGIAFKQHTFLWNNQRPKWIDSLSAPEQAAEIEEWIHDYCARYPDTDMIDVVNEATPGHAPANFARNAFGNDWIIRSFQLARRYCPNATLILNDYNVLSWNTDQFIAMAKPAIDAGVVDAIGLQAHGLEGWDVGTLKGKLDKLAQLGLPLYISEYDVAETNDQKQLAILQAQFPLFYNHPAVKGITLWGYVIGKTWVEGSGLISEYGAPRPAMNWLMNYLKEHPKSSPKPPQDTACDLPSTVQWTSTDPLISPQNPDWASIKDPTIVNYNGKYHMFATVFNSAKGSWGSVYSNFTDFSQAGSARQFDMTATATGGTVAPQVFYFEPHHKWYLIYQWGAKYSTNDDIGNPYGWSAPKSLLSNGLNNGIDYWTICDDNYCYLFFSGDDGKLYRSKVTVANFPNFNGYEVVMSDNEVGKLFEASNVYKVEGTDKYLLLVEAYEPRYFRSWTATSLDGPWMPLADTRDNPFIGQANVTFTGNPWTRDFSHGEMIRSGHNQKMEINACNMQYLYQGRDPNIKAPDYSSEPYKLGLITAR